MNASRMHFISKLFSILQNSVYAPKAGGVFDLICSTSEAASSHPLPEFVLPS